jgi:hypothetical protein
MERVELRGGEVLLLRSHGVAHGVGKIVLAGQVIAQPTDEPARLAQRIQPRRRLEFIARPAAFAE